jgi:hypothetical protein
LISSAVRRFRFNRSIRRQNTGRAFAYRFPTRRRLRQVATIATPDTIFRWLPQLIGRKWTYASGRGRRGVLAEIRQLVVRMGGESDPGLRADPRRAEGCRATVWDARRFGGSRTQRACLRSRSARPRGRGLCAPRLGRDRGSRFPHPGSLRGAAWYLLHGVCDRRSLASRANRGFDAASQRSVHASSHSDVDRRGCRVAGRPSRADL